MTAATLFALEGNTNTKTTLTLYQTPTGQTSTVPYVEIYGSLI